MNGTWTQLASKPYISYAAAQAVLADGRVIIEGGEYSNYEYDFLLTNQDATNYPLVRLTNHATHHVTYLRTHDHSSMAVASDRVSSTHFDVPAGVESGLSTLEVVANGIASQPEVVYVK